MVGHIVVNKMTYLPA